MVDNSEPGPGGGQLKFFLNCVWCRRNPPNYPISEVEDDATLRVARVVRWLVCDSPGLAVVGVAPRVSPVVSQVRGTRVLRPHTPHSLEYQVGWLAWNPRE